MEGANYLVDSLMAAAKGPLDSCTLCGAIINRPDEGAHNQFHQVHQADYEPFVTDVPGVAAETCTLCGILNNPAYRAAHDRVHQADYEPFAAARPGAAETCTICGILIDQSYRDAHNRGHG